jgi:type II secretory pathway component PulF
MSGPKGIDLTELPGIRHVLRQYRVQLFANGPARRAGKALLLHELAAAARRGMPMHLALEANARTLGEWRRHRDEGADTGAHRRHGKLEELLLLPLLLASFIGLVIYLLWATRIVDGERVSRLLAERLLTHVARGLSLSAAMARLRQDWSPDEVAIIRLGEETGQLADALARLGEAEDTLRDFDVGTQGLFYPFLVGALFFNLVLFVQSKVLPKYKDIFAQLGVDLPGATLVFAGLAEALFSNILLLAFTALLLGFLIPMMIFRFLMNGNSAAKELATAFLAATGVVGVLVTVGGAAHNNSLPWWLVLGGIVGGISLVLTLLPSLLGLIEWAVLWLERLWRRVAVIMPLFARGLRLAEEARLLGMLAVALQSGMPEGRALEAAGEHCLTRGRRRRLKSAAGLVDQGRPLADACRAARVFSPLPTARLAFAASRTDVPNLLTEIAADLAVVGRDQTARDMVLAQILLIFMLGLVGLAIALAFYMPLFIIPGAIPYEAHLIPSEVRDSWPA